MHSLNPVNCAFNFLSLRSDLRCYLAMLLLFAPHLAQAEGKDFSKRAFRRIYLGASYSKSNPVSFSESYYQASIPSSNIQYRHTMGDEWIISLSAGFKPFKDLEENNPREEVLPFFTFTQDSVRLFRIYHPTWAGAGFRIMQLIGAEKASIPYVRDPKNPPQVGAGMTMGLYHHATDNMMLHIEFSRWRSTAHNRLHAAELGFGFSYGVKP